MTRVLGACKSKDTGRYHSYPPLFDVAAADTGLPYLSKLGSGTKFTINSAVSINVTSLRHN